MTSQLNASQANILSKMLLGETKTFMPGGVGITDVRDVAEAHILALESPSAVGKR
jgi:nucleoside-diphosphate-sugar epimerase